MARNSSIIGPEDGLASTNKLLGVMIALLVRQVSKDSPSLRQQVETLSDLGLRPSEIALILGRSSTYVNKELTGIRKSQKRG